MSRREDLNLQLKGLVYVRALIETKGASTAELDAHSDAIARVRTELARLEEVGAEAVYR
jgi:hypothetical protein